MWGIIFLVIFLSGMILIGIWGMRKTSTLNDFFLGGRNVGPWITAFAYGTTYFSAVLFIGFAGRQGWLFGFNALWIALGNALFGALLAWLVLGKRTRRMTQNLDVMTMPEFFTERYQSKYMKMVSAVIIFIFLLPYSGSVFKGLGHLFQANFNIPFDIALLIMIGITGIYLVLGGYFAVTLADFIQGFIMLVGAGIMVVILVGKGGGFAQVISTVTANYPLHVPAAQQPGWLTIASLVFMTSFGVWGLPQMVQKFYAIKNENMIVKGAIATTIFSLVIVFAAYFTGAMSHVFFDNATLPMKDGKVLFDNIVPVLLTTHLPDLFMAVILILILSASMSTLSSLVLVSSSSVAIDLYKGHINPKVTKDHSLMMMRFLSVLFIILSYFIARYPIGIIVTLMSLSWGAVSGAFLAPYLLGLFWKGTTKPGAYAGMFTGLTLAIVLFFVMGPANSPLASSIAMIVPFGVVTLVSLFTKRPDKKLLDKAFQGIK
jgi:solute:Na+ symporter, SSS family